MARPSKYGDEFKKDAVRLVRESGRTCGDIARELGMNREISLGIGRYITASGPLVAGVVAAPPGSAGTLVSP
ncbi:transposase [Sphaerisporangium sp. NPDC051011]|uniref:transposase n=1 Tax=Sphaerisporangium sp. NPDC051011 TaxID=3155792 RepID=UPI0033C0DBA6